MSQNSTQSYGYRSRSRSIGKKGRRSRTPSLSPGRMVVQRPILRRGRNLVTRNTVHQFVRMTSTSSKNSLETVTGNFWGLDNQALTGFTYGGTTPSVFGNMISIYFDFLSAHIDLYSNAGALIYQAEYGLPSVAEFVALYQEFKLEWVQVDIYYQQENAFRTGSNNDSQSKSPIIYIVKDYNDGGFTSMTTMQQEQDVIQWQPGVNSRGDGYCKTIRVKPKAQFTVANIEGAAQGTAEIPGLQWMNLDTSQTIPHYGIKMSANQFFPDVGVTFAGNIGFQFTYHYAFRNTR